MRAFIGARGLGHAMGEGRDRLLSKIPPRVRARGRILNWTAFVFWLVVIAVIVTAVMVNRWRRGIVEPSLRKSVHIAWYIVGIVVGLLFVWSVIWGVGSLARLDGG